MRRLRIDTAIGVVLVALLGTPAAVTAESLKEYTNERYGFTLRYPQELLPGPVRDDGSGAEFHTGDGEFKVFAFAVPLKTKSTTAAIRQAYEHELKLFDASVSYKVREPHWFVVSGVAGNGLEFYSKAYARGSAITLLRITYPHARHEIYDGWVTRIEKSFTPVK
jgi:hypothetical protein